MRRLQSRVQRGLGVNIAPYAPAFDLHFDTIVAYSTFHRHIIDSASKVLCELCRIRNIDNMCTLRNLRIISILQPPRKPPAISAIAPMPEDFPYRQKGISRLPPFSPLISSKTEAKLPTQTPGKTFAISAFAAMPKNLPRWTERNRKIDVLRLRSDRQTSSLSKLASLGNTIVVSRLPSFSESQKTRPFFAPLPHRGHNRLHSQSASQALSLESRNIT